MSEIILEILQGYLSDSKPKYVGPTKGGEWSSPCPVCGGEDRFRMAKPRRRKCCTKKSS